MLLKLKTGQVSGYNEGQEPLIYLTTSVERIVERGLRFIFTDGHGLARFTSQYDDLAHLNEVEWELVNARYWRDTPDDNDKQRRKQAEFLVWQSLDWELIEGIAVCNESVRQRIEQILDGFPNCRRPSVSVVRDWYYY
jgi:hypothetical protein